MDDCLDPRPGRPSGVDTWLGLLHKASRQTSKKSSRPRRRIGRGLWARLAFVAAAVTTTLSPVAGWIAGAFPSPRRGRALIS
jgi:hypothetical protein